MAGSNNISLQQWTEGSTVPSSITFSGNNTNYTGTLYLHPLINTITFNNPTSIINNINFPNSIPNTGDDKDTKPFVKSTKPKEVNIICNFEDKIDLNQLIIKDNLKVKLTCNLNINNINLHKTSILRIPSNYSVCYCNSNSDKDLTVSSEEYEVKEKSYGTAQLYIRMIAIQYDYTDAMKHYYYKDMECNSCHYALPNRVELHEENITEVLRTVGKCSQCNAYFNTTTIGTMQYYLYPYFQSDDPLMQLHCVNHEFGSMVIMKVTINRDRQITDPTTSFNSMKCEDCDQWCIYDKQYVESQLQKMQIPDDWKGFPKQAVWPVTNLVESC